MYKTKITGTGTYLPEKRLTNYDLEKMVDTNHEWIIERTGISERPIAADNQVTTDLGIIAAEEAIKNAGISPKEIDFIFFATSSGDQTMPNSASVLQHKINEKFGTKLKCGALDIASACTGFLYALSITDQMIKTGAYKNILIVGAEILSRYVDYKDRGTCILFSDGAGAAIISRAEDGDESEIIAHKLRADGNLGPLLTMPYGGSAVPPSHEMIDNNMHKIKMEGREIFKNATKTMAKCSKEVLEEADFSPEKIDWLIPHQANVRIIESVAKLFKFPMDKVVVEIEKMGNNSAATIPVSLHRAITDGRIKRGQNLLLTAFGGGLTSGSLLMRY